MTCAGCRWAAGTDRPFALRCPNAGVGDVDHVVERRLDIPGLSWPANDEMNPFIRYRTLFRSYHVARAAGMPDRDYVGLVERLDDKVAGVDGRGFTVTPLTREESLSQRLGFGPTAGVWIKNETRNVSGSHKARHLMGVMVALEVANRLGLNDPSPSADLAIASCGNAALAAAVVARAAGRTLQVFVPTWVSPVVLDRLTSLGARITVCQRQEGLPGDPTYHALQRALARGALPFTCQGNENGLAIEGGLTLGYEVASALQSQHTDLDRIFLQVGGGALASAVIQGLREAEAFGAIETMPRVHTVQAVGGHPLKRAYDQVVARAVQALDGRERPLSGFAFADELASRFDSSTVQDALRYATTHRSEFMWPWEAEPKSIAEGILDDETYDWAAVVRGLLETAGRPLVVDDDTLVEANEVADETTHIVADHAGTSGLAGILHLARVPDVTPTEHVGVLFTGVRREAGR